MYGVRSHSKFVIEEPLLLPRMFLQVPRSFANCAIIACQVFLNTVGHLRIEEKLLGRGGNVEGIGKLTIFPVDPEAINFKGQRRIRRLRSNFQGWVCGILLS